MGTISARLVARAVAERLATIPTAPTYFGAVGRRVDGTLDQGPQPKGPDDPRVQPYAVLFPGFGGPGEEPDLGEAHTDLVIPFPVTVAGGDPEDVLALADRVHALLWRWAPGPLGSDGARFIAGPLRTPPGYRAELLVDRVITPHRPFVPLRYELTAHT